MKLSKTTTYNVNLSAKEAYTLKGLVQNPPEGCYPELSDLYHELFNTLPSFDELLYAMREESE
jgi:hypothetical protein